jgi:tRNA A37 threonylcarbamoyladenosine dehydratase
MIQKLKSQIEKLAKERDFESYKPEIFDLNLEADQDQVVNLIESKKIIDIVDDYPNQHEELSLVKKPTLLGNIGAIKKLQKNREDVVAEGKWVFYPWRKTLVHILNQSDFHRTRTSRNLNLILLSEQKKFEKAKIGIAGLNVGNPAAICLALEGVSNMKLADIDPLSLTNLNRFRAGLCELGLNKVVLSARQITEINPFSKLTVFEKGIVPGQTEKFLLNPKIDILVEEMDNLKLKIEIREVAKKHRIPVVMVTGNGENVIIDVERFDQDKNLPLMSGYLKKSYLEKIKNEDFSKMKVSERVILARDFMGSEHLTKRLQDSFKLVGKKLASIPQLAESSFLRGAAVTYFVREIILSRKVKSGRYNLRMDNIL